MVEGKIIYLLNAEKLLKSTKIGFRNWREFNVSCITEFYPDLSLPYHLLSILQPQNWTTIALFFAFPKFKNTV